MPSWFRLKELSAFRFSQKNISYQRAQKFLEEYKEKSGSVQNDKVYPIHEAIDDFNGRTMVFENCNYSGVRVLREGLRG